MLRENVAGDSFSSGAVTTADGRTIGLDAVVTEGPRLFSVTCFVLDRATRCFAGH